MDDIFVFIQELPFMARTVKIWSNLGLFPNLWQNPKLILLYFDVSTSTANDVVFHQSATAACRVLRELV